MKIEVKQGEPLGVDGIGTLTVESVSTQSEGSGPSRYVVTLSIVSSPITEEPDKKRRKK